VITVNNDVLTAIAPGVQYWTERAWANVGIICFMGNTASQHAVEIAKVELVTKIRGIVIHAS
jgi:hypothetical protein